MPSMHRKRNVSYLAALLGCALLTAGCSESAAPLAWQFAPNDRPGKDETFEKAIPGYGTLAGRYAKGVRAGEWEGRYEDGTHRFEGSFFLGKPVGRHRTWHPDGSDASSHNYDLEGRPDDLWQGWHDNGQVAYRYHYHEGKKSGSWKRWHADGTLAFRGAYDADAPAGEWVHFASDGSVAFRHAYETPEPEAAAPPKPPIRRRGKRPAPPAT